MAQPVRAEVEEPERIARPVLAAVPAQDQVEAPPVRHSVGRSAAAGAVLGFFVVGALIAAVAMSRDVGAQAAVALGGFVAAFGGAGFGCMVGGVLALARNADADELLRDRR